MSQTDPSPQSSLLDSIKQVIFNGIDYLASSLSLLQAQITGMALSAIVFVIILILCALMGIASFVLLTIALGIWLSHFTGNVIWSLVILGLGYALMGLITLRLSTRYLKKLNQHD